MRYATIYANSYFSKKITMENNYFIKLSEVQCDVEKKNWLNYISWSDAWAEVKKLHPEATYRKVWNEIDNTFLFRSGTGGMVLCEVTINGISHTADLAITDFRNQAIPFEKITSTDIQNTTQRAFAKWIAMHWIWLYVYRGEDFPEEHWIDVKNTPKTNETTQSATIPPKTYPKNRWDEIMDEMALVEDIEQLKTLFEELIKLAKSPKQIDFYTWVKDKHKKRIESKNIHTA